MSQNQSSYVDSLTLKALIRTASGKEGSRKTETEVTTIKRWLQKLRKKKIWIFFM